METEPLEPLITSITSILDRLVCFLARNLSTISTHELLDIYLLFCIGDEYLLFSITAQVTTRLLLDKMYQPLKISILLKVTFILRVNILSDLVTVTSHIQAVDLNSLQLS